MRGLGFAEFLDFVEASAGPAMVETMLDSCELESGGAYTTVGVYDHREVLKMLGFLNTATGRPVTEMVTAFGHHLFARLIARHPEFLRNGDSLLDFLQGIETHIHREVRKLHPDAELPYFEAVRESKKHLKLEYASSRPFADLAHGMLKGAIDHFGDTAKLEYFPASTDVGFQAEFRISVT